MASEPREGAGIKTGRQTVAFDGTRLGRHDAKEAVNLQQQPHRFTELP